MGKRKHTTVSGHRSQWSQLEEGEKPLSNRIFHSPGSHMVEGISFIFSASISFPRGVFLSTIVESVFYIHQAKLTPAVTLAKRVELGQERFQPLVSFFLGSLPPETGNPPPRHGFWVSQSACTDVRQRFLPRDRQLPVSPVYKLVKRDTSGRCGRVNHIQAFLASKMRA